VRIANDSAYGLQAYVFSSDLERAHRVAARLEAGGVMINAIRPALTAPFGGFNNPAWAGSTASLAWKPF
jgi:aldehyde dehydrogenase (NAD+)